MLENKTYDVLKWVGLICLPAISVLYSALAEAWGWGYSYEITKTLDAVAVFLGAVLGYSTYRYNREAEK